MSELTLLTYEEPAHAHARGKDCDLPRCIRVMHGHHSFRER